MGPALLLVVLFSGYTGWRFRLEYRAAVAAHKRTGAMSELLRPDELTLRDRFELLPRVLPFVILLTGVMIALYGGLFTPALNSRLCAGLSPLLIASLVRVLWASGLVP